MFKKNATTLKKQMWWKQLRMKLVLLMAILAVLLVIIIPVAVYAKRVVDANRKVCAWSAQGGIRGVEWPN